MCSHSSTEMSLEDIVDKICQKCFDFLEEFSQCETNGLISCTIDGQNNLVDIIIINERNGKLILKCNFYVRSAADTELFITFLLHLWSLLWELSKMELHSYFTKWQCHICDETAYNDTNLQIDEPICTDLDGKIWVKCIDCGLKFHTFCVLPCLDQTQDFLDFQKRH